MTYTYALLDQYTDYKSFGKPCSLVRVIAWNKEAE